MESRSICFTSFDCDKIAICEKLRQLKVSYFVIGLEICPTTQKRHLQGYAQFHKKWTLKKIGSVLGCHCEVPKASVQENITYCKKDGNFLEEGTARGISKASSNKERWTEILHLAKSGQIKEIEEKYPSAAILHKKTLDLIRDEHIAAEHHPDRRCVWIWGKSGVGKTRWAHENFKFEDIFTLSDTDGWDLYRQERVAILDEADSSLGANWKKLLRWADRYPVRARRLYGIVALNYEILIITSMKPPCQIFNEEALAAIERRFIIVHAVRYDCERNDLLLENHEDPFPLYLRNYLFNYNIFF